MNGIKNNKNIMTINKKILFILSKMQNNIKNQ